MKLLTEFNLFKKDKKKSQHDDLEVVDIVTFDDISVNNTISEIKSHMNKIIGRNINLAQHENYGSGERRMKAVEIKLNLSLREDDDALKYFFRINGIPINSNVGIKILGKRIKTAEDPYGEEDWEE